MIILVMGVSGSGKTTVGQKLAESLHYEFKDADDFHPPQNIEKMRHNQPLTDEDRQPWLQTLRCSIEQWLHQEQNVVLACSALKQAYREQLWVKPERIQLVYLKGSFEQIEARLKQRGNHFMKADLLHSQFADLEEPQTGIKVDISQPMEKILSTLLTALQC